MLTLNFLLASISTVFMLMPIDLFDQYQLEAVLNVCKQSNSAAEAGRKLFNISRQNKTSVNDSHRISQFLNKFNLDFKQIKEEH